MSNEHGERNDMGRRMRQQLTGHGTSKREIPETGGGNQAETVPRQAPLQNQAQRRQVTQGGQDRVQSQLQARMRRQMMATIRPAATASSAGRSYEPDAEAMRPSVPLAEDALGKTVSTFEDVAGFQSDSAAMPFEDVATSVASEVMATFEGMAEPVADDVSSSADAIPETDWVASEERREESPVPGRDMAESPQVAVRPRPSKASLDAAMQRQIMTRMGRAARSRGVPLARASQPEASVRPVTETPPQADADSPVGFDGDFRQDFRNGGVPRDMTTVERMDADSDEPASTGSRQEPQREAQREPSRRRTMPHRASRRVVQSDGRTDLHASQLSSDDAVPAGEAPHGRATHRDVSMRSTRPTRPTQVMPYEMSVPASPQVPRDSSQNPASHPVRQPIRQSAQDMPAASEGEVPIQQQMNRLDDKQRALLEQRSESLASRTIGNMLTFSMTLSMVLTPFALLYVLKPDCMGMLLDAPFQVIAPVALIYVIAMIFLGIRLAALFGCGPWYELTAKPIEMEHEEDEELVSLA